MKKLIQIYPRRVFNSGPGGTFGAVAIPENLLPVLGAATSAIVEATVYSLSGANAQLRLQVWHGTKADVRPSIPNGGAQIGADTVLTAAGVTNVTVAAQFHGLVELVVGGDSTDTNMSWVEAAVNATLSFE